MEFAFNSVFQHILGDSFASNVGYMDALAAAGIRPRQLVGTTRLTIRQLTIDALGKVRDSLKDGDAFKRLGGENLLSSLNATQGQQLAELWNSREMIDAVDLAMQGEVLVGFLANSLPRPQRQKRFESWLAAPGTEVADSFKPYLGLMGVSTSDSSLRTNYLKWYDATFNPTPFPDLTVGANDWALAGAVALLVAHQQGDLARSPRYAAIVESQLSQMADQILQHNPQMNTTGRLTLMAVSGAGSAPSKDEEMSDHDGLSCGAGAQRLLASEYHDKVGDWYGYLPTLGLAPLARWRAQSFFSRFRPDAAIQFQSDNLAGASRTSGGNRRSKLAPAAHARAYLRALVVGAAPNR